MEMKFVEAVKKHNAKYHTEGPYNANLFYIRSGSDAGWYVWAMGTMTFTDMDGAPGAGEHRDNWSKTVAPYVQEYGPIEFWRYNKDLSNSDGDGEGMEILWFLELERGDYYRFKAFMEKVHKVQEAAGEEMHIWNNSFNQGDGRDVAISFPFAKWADLDDNEWRIDKAYDEEYGEGAWENALEEWEDFVVGMSEEVWMTVPKD